MINIHSKVHNKNIELWAMYITTTKNDYVTCKQKMLTCEQCTRWHKKHDYVTCWVARHGHGYTLLNSDIYNNKFYIYYN